VRPRCDGAVRPWEWRATTNRLLRSAAIKGVSFKSLLLLPGEAISGRTARRRQRGGLGCGGAEVVCADEMPDGLSAA
jgi:hypothetical protein